MKSSDALITTEDLSTNEPSHVMSLEVLFLLKFFVRQGSEYIIIF